MAWLEHHKEPVLHAWGFRLRVAGVLASAGLLVGVSLCIGAMGYHFTEGIAWLDAFLNAAMILTGMGPVSALQTTAGKAFAIVYALYSGIVFLATTGLVLTPFLHRLLHRFHRARGDEG